MGTYTHRRLRAVAIDGFQHLRSSMRLYASIGIAR